MVTKIISQLFRNIRQRTFLFYIRNISPHINLHNEPYISGDNFKRISDHVVTKNKKFNFRNIKVNEIVFVDGKNLTYFIDEIIDNIECKFNIIVHNSDFEINEILIKKILYKEITLFSQNLNIDFKKYKNCFLLPTGLKNKRQIKNSKISVYKKLTKPAYKLNNIFISMSYIKHPERIALLKLIYNNDLFVYHRYSDQINFLNQMSKYKYVACPRGKKIDTVLIWECLLVRSIPIVVKSNFSQELKNIGIPLLEINNWDDLGNYDLHNLEEIYQLESKKFNSDIYCYFSFWQKYIEDKLEKSNN